jgi:hypothetical protein
MIRFQHPGANSPHITSSQEKDPTKEQTPVLTFKRMHLPSRRKETTPPCITRTHSPQQE